MTCRELFDSAVALLCEDPSDSERIFDYTERGPYLFAMLVMQTLPLDAEYRLAYGLEAGGGFSATVLPLESKFPLSEAFAPAAVYYVAAMLVADENEDLMDKLFALYTDTVSAIQASLPASISPITDKYSLR